VTATLLAVVYPNPLRPNSSAASKVVPDPIKQSATKPLAVDDAATMTLACRSSSLSDSRNLDILVMGILEIHPYILQRNSRTLYVEEDLATWIPVL